MWKSTGARLAIATAALVAGSCGCAGTSSKAAGPPGSSVVFPPPPPATHIVKAAPRPKGARAPRVPAPLFAKGLDVRAGPVPVPIVLQIPALSLDAAVLGVGVTRTDVMDAPEGPVNDPVWNEAFWYRGSAVPGVISTALIAGHIDGPRGTTGVFAHIDQLRPGDLIVVHDTRSDLDVRFAVTHTTSYPLSQTTDPNVLREIYGVGPVAGTTPQQSVDGLAHLTLITCSGTFDRSIGTHDHRLAVFATRV